MVERNLVLGKVRQRLRRDGLDAYLVSEEKNITYLTGCFSSGAKMLIFKSRRPIYFIDSMNSALVRKKLKGLALGDIVSGAVLGEVKKTLKSQKIKKLGIDAKDLSVGEYEYLSSGIKRLKKVHFSGVVETLRKKKRSVEIITLRKAAKETIKIWGCIKRRIKSGMTEKEIAKMIDVAIRDRGYENSFSTIAAAGKNTAYPHATPTNKALKKGEHLLVDFGICLNGYCSDLTRTYSEGRIDRQIGLFKKYVREAQDLVIKKMKPGVKIGALAAEVNNTFKQLGLESEILHGLGHGVGLDIHESPFLFEGSGDKLAAGMVVTVEPGLYREGLGGIRREDMVLITAKGCEVLTR